MKKLLLGLAASLATLTGHATIYDLTTSSTVFVPTAYGDAVFSTSYTTPCCGNPATPFLTLGGNGVESGFNSTSTAGNGAVQGASLTREIRLSDLQAATIGGRIYYTFVLDLNESANSPAISLDMLQIYTKGGSSALVERFDLGFTSGSYIKMQADGSTTRPEVAFFIPVNSFISGANPANPNDYVYIYEKFGANIAASSTGAPNNGFEQTAIQNCVFVTPIPEVSTILPLGLVLGGVIGASRLRRRSVFAA